MASLETIAVWIIIISSTSAVAISIGLYFGLEPRNNIWIIINRFRNRNIKTEEKTDELKEKNELLEKTVDLSTRTFDEKNKEI